MKTVIIGAGFAGLSAAHILKDNFIILEAGVRPGGLCRTEVKGGFTFDYTGHLMHLRHKQTEKFILKHTPVKMNKIKRKAVIFSSGVYTKYPYQANNYGLPTETVEENLTGFIRAKLNNKEDKSSFKNWCLSVMGEGISKNFMLPYNSKLLKHPLDKITLSWLGRFVPRPEIDDIINGIEEKGKEGAGYNASFYYPERGGIESVIRGIYEPVKDKVILNTAVKKVDLKNKIVYFPSGEIKYDKLISTMPLKKFLMLTGNSGYIRAAKGLKARTVYSLNVGYRTENPTDVNWVYVPEPKYPFYRIGFPHTFSPYNAPAGLSSVFAEVSVKGEVPKNTDSQIINGLIKMKVLKKKSDIKVLLPLLLPDAYVIFDSYRDSTVPEIEKKLSAQGVILAGRWGRWEYSSMEDAVMEGFEAAKKAAGGA